MPEKIDSKSVKENLSTKVTEMFEILKPSKVEE